jgi:hypothetical protein
MLPGAERRRLALRVDLAGPNSLSRAIRERLRAALMPPPMVG